MNQTSNETDESYYYYNLDEFLTQYGSTYALEAFNFYPFIVVSVLGLILNGLAGYIFSTRAFESKLYVYLRVYCVNNMLMCFLNIFNFTYTIFRALDWTNSYASQFYYAYIYSPLINIIYFYGTFLDMLILLDRISFFNKRVKRFMKRPAYLQCLIWLVITLILDAPYYINFMPDQRTIRLNATHNFTIWFDNLTEISQVRVAFVLNLVTGVIRDVVCLIMEVLLNIYTVYLIREFLNKKKKHVMGESTTIHVIDPNARKSSRATLNLPPRSSLTVLQARRSELITGTDQKVILMVTLMCLLSISEHGINLANFVYPYISYDLITYILYDVANFFGTFKRFCNFFVFFFFNLKFRTACIQLVRRQRAWSAQK